MTKVCSNPNCIHKGKPQPRSNFHKRTASNDNLCCWCKDCIREKRKKYIPSEKAIISRRQRQKNYRKTKKGRENAKKGLIKFKSKNPNYMKEWQKKNPRVSKKKHERLKAEIEELKKALALYQNDTTPSQTPINPSN